MKKVLVSAYACSPIRGTEPGLGWSWTVNIAREGYEVWCLTNVEDKEAILEAHKKLNLPNLHFVFVDLPYGIDKRFLDTSSKKIYLHYLLWRRKAGKVALKLHEQIHFDVAHHVTFGSLQQGTYLWKLKGVQFIFGPVGGGQKALPEFREYFGSAWKMEIIRDIVSRFSLRFSSDLKNTVEQADHILVANQETGDMVRSIRQRNNIHVVLDNAVPANMQHVKYKERSAAKKLKLVWVGRMLPRKGLKMLMHAISFLPADTDYEFTIVGGGEQFPLIPGWINEYKLDPAKIHIVGEVPFAEVVKYYEQSDVLLFCSLRDSGGVQLNEAMAFGLPVITLDTNGASLAVPDNCGIKIKPTTKEGTAIAISEAILRFYNDPSFRKACSINAFNHAKTNTWENKVRLVTSNYYA